MTSASSVDTGAVTPNMTSASIVDTGAITPNDEREQCGRSSEWQIIKSLNGKVINAKHSASYDSYESHPSSKALLTFIKNAEQCVT
jgi:hypothetical protein